MIIAQKASFVNGEFACNASSALDTQLIAILTQCHLEGWKRPALEKIVKRFAEYHGERQHRCCYCLGLFANCHTIHMADPGEQEFFILAVCVSCAHKAARHTLTDGAKANLAEYGFGGHE